jgi:hypothetical protein
MVTREQAVAARIKLREMMAPSRSDFTAVFGRDGQDFTVKVLVHVLPNPNPFPAEIDGVKIHVEETGDIMGVGWC